MKLKRVVEARVAGLRIRDLYIAFDIDRRANGIPAGGRVDVYNLSPTDERSIFERGEVIEIYAGYDDPREDAPPLLARGDVRRVRRSRKPRDRVTSIGFGGFARALTESYLSRTWRGEISARRLVRDAVDSVDSITLGPSVSEIPEDLTEIDFSWSGNVPTMLRDLLARRGIEWYEQDGVIDFKSAGSAGVGEPVRIGPDTGMIGTPTVTDEGIEVATLLDPRLRLDSRFVVDGIGRAEASPPQWSVFAVRHSGDNREGEFRTVARGVDPERAGVSGALGL